MTLDDLRNLDLDVRNAGRWPMPVKIVMCVVLGAALLFAGYWFDTQDQLVRLDGEEKKEVELRQVFETKQARAVNLDAYRAQLKEMRESFGEMLRQLPNKTEVAELLVDVSQTGLAAGLEFELFEPVDEVPKEFYAELPIRIRVIGDYHQFGNFISGLAALPRIVTLHDIRIVPRGDGKSADEKPLTMEATARTYRYLDEGPGT